MLAIRLQRTGRSGHAQFRIIVQDSHLSPKSGKLVAIIGSYNPHTKAISLDKEKAIFYLDHGAQPSERIVGILKLEGVKLPKWVGKPIKQSAKTRYPEKLRKNQPEKPVVADEPSEAPAEEPTDKPEAPAEGSANPEASTDSVQTPEPEAETEK